MNKRNGRMFYYASIYLFLMILCEFALIHVIPQLYRQEMHNSHESTAMVLVVYDKHVCRLCMASIDSVLCTFLFL